MLVLDRHTRDLIAPLLKVNDLRRHGVTLHLLLESDRQPIPDVPAVYFVRPTRCLLRLLRPSPSSVCPLAIAIPLRVWWGSSSLPPTIDVRLSQLCPVDVRGWTDKIGWAWLHSEHVRRVVADAAADTYAAIHLHFASPTPRSLLEELASETVKADCMGKLACVFDEYLDFLTLERGMFSLGMLKTYVRLNDPSARDTDVEVRAAYTLRCLRCLRCLRLLDPPHVGAVPPPAQPRWQQRGGALTGG